MIKRPYISICQQLWSQNSPSNNHFNIECLLWFFCFSGCVVLFCIVQLFSPVFVLIVFGYSLLLLHVILFGYFILLLCLHYSTNFYCFHTLCYFLQVPCTHHLHCFHALCYSNYFSLLLALCLLSITLCPLLQVNLEGNCYELLQ